MCCSLQKRKQGLNYLPGSSDKLRTMTLTLAYLIKWEMEKSLILRWMTRTPFSLDSPWKSTLELEEFDFKSGFMWLSASMPGTPQPEVADHKFDWRVLKEEKGEDVAKAPSTKGSQLVAIMRTGKPGPTTKNSPYAQKVEKDIEFGFV